jgi:predicted nucleotidyltransferase
MPTLESIRAHKPEILALAEKCAVDNIRIFGSVARGDATDTSDVDFLVLPYPERYPLGMVAFKHDLSDLLQCKVDVLSERGIHHLIRENVFKEAIPL